MTTIEMLDAHLRTPIKLLSGFEYKEVAPAVICKDGTSLSVQANEYSYCIPRNNYGPWTHVEVWCVTAPVSEFEYDEEEPSAYVPIEQVVEFIDNHGGFGEVLKLC